MIKIEEYKQGDKVRVNNQDWIVVNVNGYYGTDITISPEGKTKFDIMQQHTKNDQKTSN